MSLKMRKTCQKIKKLSQLVSTEKENIGLSSGLEVEKHVRQPNKASLESTKLEENKLLLLPLKPGVKMKTLGFWSKKLQDLEESITKNKKHELYEFNETDGFDSSQRKKKTKKKVMQQKKRELFIYNYNNLVENNNKVSESKRKIKEFHRHSLCREQIILTRERKKLAEKGNKFTFSAGIPSFGITSTPTVKKDNLIGASNFLFLSPIINKEKADCYGSINQNCLDTGTPKVQTELNRINCRVLRSGKVLKT